MKNLSYMILALTASAAVPFTLGVARQSATSLTVTYVDCPRNLQRQSSPRVTVLDWHGKELRQQSFDSTPAKELRVFRLSLAPGFYTVLVVNGECHDDLLVTILPDHSRDVVAIGRSSVRFTDYNAMVSGTLPSPGWQVRIVYRDRVGMGADRTSPDGHLEYPAAVDGGAYYAVWLPDGKVTVRLYNQARDRWLDFDAGRLDSGRGRTGLVRNITAADVAEAVKAEPRKATCLRNRSGVLVCQPAP